MVIPFVLKIVAVRIDHIQEQELEEPKVMWIGSVESIQSL
jgi:hypothetical protein